jgi:hypothetical protein
MKRDGMFPTSVLAIEIVAAVSGPVGTGCCESVAGEVVKDLLEPEHP